MINSEMCFRFSNLPRGESILSKKNRMQKKLNRKLIERISNFPTSLDFIQIGGSCFDFYVSGHDCCDDRGDDDGWRIILYAVGILDRKG